MGLRNETVVAIAVVGLDTVHIMGDLNLVVHHADAKEVAGQDQGQMVRTKVQVGT